MTHMSQEGREALRQYKAALSRASGDPQDAWDDIVARIEAGEAGLDVTLPKMQRSKRSRWIAAGGAGLAIAAATVLTVTWPNLAQRVALGNPQEGAYAAETPNDHDRATVRAATSDQRRANTPTRAATTPTMPAITPPLPAAQPGTVALIPTAAEAMRTTKRRVAKRPVPKDTAVETIPVSRLREEVALLAEARAALRDNRPGSALRLLGMHARSFAEGELRDERAVLEIAALCELGEGEQARKAGEAFVAQHPNSPLSAHASRLCRDLD